MNSIRTSGLFREPDRVRTGPIFLACALFQFAIYGYYSVVQGTTAEFFLVLGSICLVGGLPEFLPTERRRLVGAARIAAIGYILVVVMYFLFLA